MKFVMILVCVVSVLFALFTIFLAKSRKKPLSKGDIRCLIVCAVILFLGLTTKVTVREYKGSEVVFKALQIAFDSEDYKEKTISSKKKERIIEKENLLGQKEYIIYMHK